MCASQSLSKFSWRKLRSLRPRMVARRVVGGGFGVCMSTCLGEARHAERFVWLLSLSLGYFVGRVVCGHAPVSASQSSIVLEIQPIPMGE